MKPAYFAQSLSRINIDTNNYPAETELDINQLTLAEPYLEP